MITATDRDGAVLLDGEWQIAFDEANVGKREGWQQRDTPLADAAPIAVPSCWEEIKPGYDGVAWYWRVIRGQRRHPGDRVVLRFDAVNYLTEVWIDGNHAGQSEGGYTPFSFDISDWVRDGADHLLSVRVLAPPRDEVGIDGIVLKETPCWRTWESFNFGGIWQSVRLLHLPSTYIADCFVEPTPELDSAIVHPTLVAHGEDAPVTLGCSIYKWQAADQVVGHIVRQFESIDEANDAAIRVPMADPEPWSPDRPALYLLKLRMATTHQARPVKDEVAFRFGLRWFSFRDNRFVLNGEPIFVKGGFHEGLYPIGLPRPPSREFVRDELQKAKDCGFNLLRYWQIPIHPWVLDAADELGVMLCNEPPVEWMTQTQQTAARCRSQVERLVRRDRNRPSVVMWTILNEGGICPDYNRRNFGAFTEHEWETAPVQREREGLCHLARSLDPTRPIIDDSGGWVVGANVYLPHSYEKTRLNDLHVYRRAPVPEHDINWFSTVGSRTVRQGHRNVEGGVGVFMSEFGYGSFPDLEGILERYTAHGAPPDLEDVAHHRALLDSLREGFGKNRMERSYPDVKALCEASQLNHAEGNALQALALRANPLVAGYVMHAFSAGGCILGAELFDTWRRPKLVAQHVSEAQKDHVLAVFLEHRSVAPGEPVRARVVSVCDAGLDGLADLDLFASISSPGGDVDRSCLGQVDIEQRIQTIWEGELPLADSRGMHEIMFELCDGASVVARGQRQAFVVAAAPLPENWSLCVLGPGRQNLARTAERLGARCVRSPVDATHLVAVGSGSAGVMPYGHRELVANGRTLLLLAPSPQAIRWAMDCFSIPGEIASAVGNWSPVCHTIDDKGLQADLPTDPILGQAYADVLPTHCVRTDAGRTMAGCFSYHQGHIFTKQTEVWWGKTVMEKRYGRGRIVLCTFRLEEAIDRDPVARNLFVNLVGLAG